MSETELDGQILTVTVGRILRGKDGLLVVLVVVVAD